MCIIAIYCIHKGPLGPRGPLRHPEVPRRAPGGGQRQDLGPAEAARGPEAAAPGLHAADGRDEEDRRPEASPAAATAGQPQARRGVRADRRAKRARRRAPPGRRRLVAACAGLPRQLRDPLAGTSDARAAAQRPVGRAQGGLAGAREAASHLACGGLVVGQGEPARGCGHEARQVRSPADAGPRGEGGPCCRCFARRKPRASRAKLEGAWVFGRRVVTCLWGTSYQKVAKPICDQKQFGDAHTPFVLTLSFDLKNKRPL